MTNLALCAERVPAAWGSAWAMSGPPQLKSLSGRRVPAAWGSAGAMSGPPQLKSLKDLDGGPPHHHRGDH